MPKAPINVTGDGAGVLIQIPHKLILSKGIKVPDEGKYGTGLVFLPKDAKNRQLCEKILIDTIVEEGLDVVDFHDVIVDSSILGEISRSTEPFIRQIYVAGKYEQDELERRLYIARKQAENKVRQSNIQDKQAFYLPSLS
ncbi:MAG: hypothetical protein HC906_01055, partial [Bacteroidales bacterium]|nr:hypothetical protein [Bacteroidales bacterium]